MSRKIVIFDMDDTLCSFVPHVLELASETLGRPIELERMEVNWMWSVMSESEWELIRPKIYTPAFYSRLPLREPQPLIQSTFETLIGRGYGIQILTARTAPLGDAAELVTKAWLAKHSLAPYIDHVVICHHTQDKTELFTSDTVAIVEDSPHIVAAAEAKGVPVLLIDQPWNRSVPLGANSARLQFAHQVVDKIGHRA